MGRLEKLVCYATLPIVFPLLIGVGVLVGGAFMVVGVMGYLKPLKVSYTLEV